MITDTIGNVLADDAVIGTRESLHNPFGANSISFVKSNGWLAEPGQTIAYVDGDNVTPKMTVTSSVKLVDIFVKLVGPTIPAWMQTTNLNFALIINSRIYHVSNKAFDITSPSTFYNPFAQEVAIGFGSEYNKMDVYGLKLVTV